MQTSFEFSLTRLFRSIYGCAFAWILVCLLAGSLAAKATAQPIALGKSIGLDEFATSQGARTLMKDPNFLNTISSELRAGTKFSVDLSGISGDVGPAIQRAASGRGSPV